MHYRAPLTKDIVIDQECLSEGTDIKKKCMISPTDIAPCDSNKVNVVIVDDPQPVAIQLVQSPSSLVQQQCIKTLVSFGRYSVYFNKHNA